MIEQDATIVADGLEQMLDQFNESVKLRALAASYLQSIQNFEDAAYPILAERGINNATGDRLDGIGQIFNVARGGRDDTDYRLALILELAILQSNGTEADLLTIAQLLVQMATANYEFLEYFPKTVYIRPVNHVLLQDPMLVTTGLKRSVSASTEMLFVYSFRVDSLTFQCSSQPATVETNPNLGLSNDTKTTGGHLAQSL